MRRLLVLALGVVALTACSTGTTAQPIPTATTPSPAVTSTSPATPVVLSAAPTAVATRPAPAAPPTTAAPRRTAAGTAVELCPDVPAVPGDQVLLVVGSGSTARVRACERRAGQWVSVLGVLRGHVGRRGVAPAGAKREGDLRTPSGTFALGRGFGQRSDPGVRFSWRVVGPRDVWVDDPASELYNTWQQTPAAGRWDSAEPLDVPGYAYAQVIDDNTARVPGRGSAIFLHVDSGRATLGCVALPRADLLRVLRWERAGARIVIR